jgi:rhodanese-related sulfurtransferase
MRLFCLFLFSTLLCGVSACQNEPKAVPPASKKMDPLTAGLLDKSIIRIWPAELDSLRKVDPNLPLVDVRTDIEFNHAHILRAMNCAVSDADFEQRIIKLDREMPVIIYDDQSQRSLEAAVKMRALGFKRIYELSGGVFTWARDGRVMISTQSKADPATILR